MAKQSKRRPRQVFRVASHRIVSGSVSSGRIRRPVLEVGRANGVAPGIVVLCLHRRSRTTAWLLALLFCAFIAAPDLVIPSGVSPALVAFVLAFCAIFLGMLGPLFYLFFAVFPTQSPLDRRFPWLKWLALAFGVSIALPGLRAGHP